MRKYILKIMKYSGSLAVAIAFLSSNTTCTWHIHQPKVPNSVKNLKNKF
ncbi:cyclic lactone autoinducer peptide [[Eubacterium] tenue]|nr:cyclic lactone autoinducer peptide [[Eubacterium] tenue]MBC8632564.1 cyclic lactone autoinducer peptide [[Eubacterium] tenue]